MARGRIICQACGTSVRRPGGRSHTCGQCGGAIRPPVEESRLGRVLWRRASRYKRAVVILPAVIGAATAAGFVRTFFTYTERSRYGDEAVGAAILVGVSSILFAVASKKLLGISVAILGGGVLIAKPLLFPMISFHTEEAYRLTSETHLNFLVPGGLLLALAGIQTLILRVGTASRKSS